MAAAGSELCWLAALRADTGLAVPEPFRTAEGSLTTIATSRQVPQPRVCSVLRWIRHRRLQPTILQTYPSARVTWPIRQHAPRVLRR